MALNSAAERRRAREVENARGARTGYRPSSTADFGSAQGPRIISVEKVVRDPRAQPRAGIDEGLVAEYAEAMSAGALFPAVKVFFDGKKYYLADGFHRVAAALLAGLSEISAEVTPGGLREAILYSVGANAAHGKRRTNEDKRKAVFTLLKDPEWAAWADREIARQCLVSQPFVSSCRQELSDNGYQMPDARLVQRGGAVFEQKVAGPRTSKSTPDPVARACTAMDRAVAGLAGRQKLTVLRQLQRHLKSL